MKVAYNARILSDPQTRGWARYTLNLLKEIRERNVVPILLTDRELASNHLNNLAISNEQVKVLPSKSYLQWEQQLVPRFCREEGIEIYHSPINFGLPIFSPCPRVITIHDVIDFKVPKMSWMFSLKGLKSKFYHELAYRCADHIITVSEYSKKDIIENLHVPEEKISVTLEAHDPTLIRLNPKASDILDKFHISMPYFLYVGGWDPRKNIPFLVESFLKLNSTKSSLVLAGGTDEEIKKIDSQYSIQQSNINIKLLGKVTPEELSALYSQPLAFIYPSRHEGFGLQLCEAMAHGVPVLAARSTSLPEILGSGGELFTLDNNSELTTLMGQLEKSEEMRKDLSRRSLKRSQDFSWSITAQKTLEVYQSLLRKGQ